jgi:phage baseplate assembly protein W
MNGDDPFGHSLAVVDGDLVFDVVPVPDPDGATRSTVRRLRSVAGRANLLQAIELRVRTPFGSDMFHTGYGTDFARIFAQPGGVRATKDLITLNLVRTIAGDSRVRDVREVTFVDHTVATDTHHRLWHVDVVIDTADGQTAALMLRLMG